MVRTQGCPEYKGTVGMALLKPNPTGDRGMVYPSESSSKENSEELSQSSHFLNELGNTLKHCLRVPFPSSQRLYGSVHQTPARNLARPIGMQAAVRIKNPWQYRKYPENFSGTLMSERSPITNRRITADASLWFPLNSFIPTRRKSPNGRSSGPV